MSETNYQEAAEFLYENLRLKTMPVAVKFVKDGQFPEKTVRPKDRLGKKITLCMGVTMARSYGWTVGLAKEDIICVPAMISFGFTGARNQVETVAKLFTEVTFSQDREAGAKETSSMSFIPSGEINAVLLAPLARANFEPDVVAVYGNPAFSRNLRSTFVIAAGMRPLDGEGLFDTEGREIARKIGPEVLADLAARNGTSPLTDDHAPVENLMVPVFLNTITK